MKKIIFTLVAFIALQLAAVAQSKCEVLWNGSWFPATVLQTGDDQWKIHYDNYGAEWDEWVGADRIKFTWKKGDKVQVLWNAEWYKAEIIEVNGAKYKIHYDGYGAEWDEWVGLDRMKN